ncbi:hypothetical protein DEFDS_0363 [Deferribacter desulfuricans SSM1]|uniref:Uncharacterized protein n=1 Tax=Deferribacter desulfuricans (strain DSM 14783 / JCM 11476 / NBRC 101012 / SSM1) TaxID=639282 RepID=D3PB86_DEFDS|nr:hypothetical protein [Deferribacter desulfuricans]BAI79859.1 hypothetical protein DEFDS_0363 [Deferribacter desulfuricans SSM1]
MGIYWNIKKNSDIDEATMIEHTLKYGDLDDIIELFKRINNNKIKGIWLKTMAPDKRFLKLNLMVARIFFDMDVEKDYFEGLDNARFKVRVSVK